MTICIAALCSHDESPAVVVAADTQISWGTTSSEFHVKSESLGHGWSALISASDLSHAEQLIVAIRDRLAESPDSVTTLLWKLREAQEATAEYLAAAAILPPGLTLADFYHWGRKRLPGWAFYQTWDRLQRFHLGCDLLILGFDPQGSPHIITAGFDGPHVRDREACAAVGSGVDAAMTIITAQDLTEADSLRRVAYYVYAAKKASERAAGVGEVTMISAVSRRRVLSIEPRALQPLYAKYGAMPGKEQGAMLGIELDNLADDVLFNPSLTVVR